MNFGTGEESLAHNAQPVSPHVTTLTQIGLSVKPKLVIQDCILYMKRKRRDEKFYRNTKKSVVEQFKHPVQNRLVLSVV